MMPHPDKKRRAGEDAFYAHNDILTVADGVGGWIHDQIDSAHFSRKLCDNIREFFMSDKKKYKSNSKELLYESTVNNQKMGSSTVVVAILNSDQRKLNTALVGDSGYIILRPEGKKYRVVFQSEEQLHDFNTPFQLGTMGIKGDHPRTAIEKEHSIRLNDIIILATDGLFDNLYQEEIVKLVEEFTSGQEYSSSKLAIFLAEKTKEKSFNTEDITPYSEKAREKDIYYKGGKKDDITILVARIEELS